MKRNGRVGKGSGRFLKKAPQKIFLIGAWVVVAAAPFGGLAKLTHPTEHGAWFFFSKKNCFLTLAVVA
jgi:hypothetical protein